MKILLRMYDETLHGVLPQLTPGERKFLIDIFNATMLTGLLGGDHIIAQAEDSFTISGEDYEAKWGIERGALMDKLTALTPWQRGCLEIWANSFWYGSPARDVSAPDAIDHYLPGPSLRQAFGQALEELRRSIELMGDSRHHFKSKTIAEARDLAERAYNSLRTIV